MMALYFQLSQPERITSPMLDQRQRHQYLDALGITSWLPTQPLPAAAPSAEWVWDFRYPAPEISFTPQPAGGGAPRQQAPAAPKMDPARARAALNDTLALVADAAKPKDQQKREEPQVKLAPKPKQTAEIPRFRLAMLALGDCLVVDSLPTVQGGEFSEQHRTLLKNISHFLLSEPAEMPRAGILNWPMLANSSLDQSRPEALAAVQYKLKQLINRNGSKRVLLLGEAAMQMVLDTDAGLDSMRGSVQLPAFPELKVVVSYSLSQLLRLHDMKADLWQDIQPIIKD